MSPQPPPEDRIGRDVDDEIAFHLEQRVRDLMDQGHTLAAARRVAREEFGNVAEARVELAAVDVDREQATRVRWHDAMGQELRHALRSLIRVPAFAVTATITLGIGIGAISATLAVVHGVLLRPLPYGDPDRLVAAFHDMPSIGLVHAEQSAATYITYQRLARTIDGIGVYRTSDVNITTPPDNGAPERVTLAAVSATLMPLLEVAPLLGRAFTEADDRRGASPVVMIDEGLWRARFGADPQVIGRTLSVNGVIREVIGVMASTFRFPTAATRLWIPAEIDPLDPPGAGFEFQGVARLKSGVSVAEAERDFTAVLPRAPDLVPRFVQGISTRQIIDQVHPRPVLVPLRASITGRIAPTLWLVAAAGVLVWLVACANVANLVLVRADGRRREVALRAALGAERSRLVLSFVLESGLIATLATVMGLLAAEAALYLLAAAAPAGLPRVAEIGLDGSTLFCGLGAAVTAALACGLLPALRVSGERLGTEMGSRGGTASRAQHRVRAGLVVAQMALALVMLAGAGLLVRTYQRLHAVPAGFDPAHVSTFWIAAPAASYQTDAAIVAFYTRLLDRVAALPDVESVGLTSRLPLEPNGVDPNPIYPEGDPSFVSSLPPLQLLTAATDGYFRAMRIPIVAGHSFTRLGAQREGEALISLSTARFFWKDQTGVAAIGQQFRPVPNGHLYTVIGVAGDVEDTALSAPPGQVVYFPEAVEAAGPSRTKRTLALVVKTSGDSPMLRVGVQQSLHDLDPTLPLFGVKPLSAVMTDATAELSLTMLLLGAAALVTLVLGAVGLYGVLAYLVTLRTRELGIRLALGASPRGMAIALARQGLFLAVAGLVLGAPIVAAAARLINGLLYGVTAADPVALAGAAAVLVMVAMLASWLPARRAARVDPVVALRAD